MLDTIRPSLARFLASRMDAPPPRLGIRYDAAGNFLFEPGNTIVCHLARRSASEAAVLQVRERLLALPGADCLAFTPAASLHMTLFQGVVDTRRKHPYWPADIPVHLGIDEMTRRMMTRLDGFDGCGPFSVKVTEVTPTGLTVEGVTEEDANVMRAWRDKLARTFGASRAQVLRLVVLPGSVPTLIAALKMNIGLALVGVIVGEFQSANAGLGFLILNGSQVFKLNIVMTAIVILGLMSGLMYLAIARLEAVLARRYA